MIFKRRRPVEKWPLPQLLRQVVLCMASDPEVLEVHGTIEARDGHYDLARAAYTEGLHRAAAMPFPYGQARLLHAHGLLDRQQHDHAAAHAKLAQALAIFDNLGASQDAARLRQAIADTPGSG